MPSLRMLWNHLAPGRRRRRYYFLHVLARLVDLEVDPSTWPAIFRVSSIDFREFETGYSNPPAYVEQLAIAAYKVPRPPALTLYAPTLCVAAGVAFVVALRALLR